MRDGRLVAKWAALFFGVPGLVGLVIWAALHPGVVDVVLGTVAVIAGVLVWGAVCALLVSEL